METVEHQTGEEVRRALSRLRPPTIVRLTALARNWVRVTPRRESEDLLNEALGRVLSGRRRWPVGMPLDVFLNGVMRSVASQWAAEDASAILVDLDEADTVTTVSDTSQVEFRSALAHMRRVLAEDAEALGILDGIVAGSSRSEIQDSLGIDETAYDTGRRRMARLLAKALGPDWKDKI